MTLCRRSQKLATSNGVCHFLLQAFFRPALRVRQRNTTWILREEARYAYTSAQGQLPDNMGRAELSPTRESRISDHPRYSRPRTMCRSLEKKLMGLSDVKEDVYGALDEWTAFELEFPVVATRMLLERLRKQEQWHRIIQVTKWMFSKGIGKTHGAYGLLLRAYCMEGRLDEAEELWNSLVTLNGRSMPKGLFAQFTNVYRKKEMPKKVIEVFEQMESFGIKPDKDTLMRAKEAFQQLNMEEKVEELGKRYALDSRTRRKDKRLKERRAKKAMKLGRFSEKSVDQVEGNGNLEYQTDGDELDADKQVSSVCYREERRSSSKTEEISNRPKSLQRGIKLGLTSTAEDDFVKQVIDTM